MTSWPPAELAGRSALVTAAVGPLGRVLAVGLAEAGLHVSVTTLTGAREEEFQANSILNECWSLGRRGGAHAPDLADPGPVESMARSGVTVNALAAGLIEGLPGPHADAQARAAIERYIPSRRIGRPEDLVGALIYLVSDAAAYVNAEVLAVDGGLAVHA